MIFTCFGDMMRVPGGDGTLLDAKAEGADIRMVYSPLDALRIARENPDREVVFFAVGFETTAPSTALTLMRAKAEGIANFSVLLQPRHDRAAAHARCSSRPTCGWTASSAPATSRPSSARGRSSSSRPTTRKPIVISGFEPLDLLQSVAHGAAPARARAAARSRTSTARVVPYDGNPSALRGARGGVRAAAALRVARARLHLAQRPASSPRRTPTSTPSCASSVPGVRVADPKACQCGEVLKGVIKPWECKVFGTACTPERPIGTCMVSSEGACAAYYNFGRFARERDGGV